MHLALNNSESVLQRRPVQSVSGQSYSPPTCPSLRCCSGRVWERSCLLWRWSESRGIPASSPTLRKEPLHRCSPKVNEALWFCGSSVFLNEALSWPGLNILRVLISPLFCWFTSPVWFRKWQSHKSIFPLLPQNFSLPEESLTLTSSNSSEGGGN